MSSLYRRKKVYWLSYRKAGKAYSKSLHTQDRSTAIYEKAKIDRELIEGKSVFPDKEIFLSDLLEKYTEEYKHNKAASTLKKDLAQLNSFIASANNLKLSKVTEETVKNYLNKRMGSGELKDKAANRYIAVIKHFFNYAVKKRLIFENPAKFIKGFKTEKNPVRFLSQAEIETILSVSADPKIYVDGNPTLYPFIMTAILTGMRPQELFTLRWEDIDFDKGVINVLNKPGFQTKSRKWRPIPLHKDLKKILPGYKKESEKCFDTTNWRRIWRRILKGSKLNGQRINLYTLRHTFGSHLVMNGVPLPTVKELMGHASIQTTMIYVHLTPGHLKESVDKLKISLQ